VPATRRPVDDTSLPLHQLALKRLYDALNAAACPAQFLGFFAPLDW
jgi:hypothetical protein